MTEENEVFNIPGRPKKNWGQILEILRDMTEVSAVFLARIKETDNIEILRSVMDSDINLEHEEIYQFIKKVKSRGELTQKTNSPEDRYPFSAGIPIFFSQEDKIFGTLNIIDKTSREFGERDKKLFLELKRIIEKQLAEFDKIEEEAEMEGDYYRTMFETAPIGIMLEDAEGNILKVNDSLCEITGYNKEELEGSSVFDKFVLPEQKEQARENIKKVLAGEDLEFDIKTISKDGQEFYTYIKETNIILPNGEPGILSMQTDITKRKKLEEKLKLTQFSMENAAVGIFWITPGGEFEYVNKLACEMLGYKQKELTGKRISDIDPTRTKKERKERWEILKKNNILRVETRLSSKTGETFTVQITSRYLQYNDREYEFAFVQDITALKEKENKLKQKNERREKLHQVAFELQKLDSENNICEKTVEAAEELLDFKFCNISLVEGEEFVPKAATQKIEYERKHITEGIAGKTYQEGESIHINKVENHAEAEPVKSDYRSGLSIPVGEYGVFQAVALEENAFSQEDLELAELLLAHTTSALERIYAQQELKHKTFHDELTGIYNRRFMEEEMKRLNTRRQLPLSIIMADINGLKIINDSLGHDKGDELLKKAARLLENNTRDEDILARYGGDEFVILLPQTTEEKVHDIYERIKSVCEDTEADELPVSLGIGTATKKTPGEELQEILKAADNSMQQDKLLNRRSKKSKLVESLLNTLAAKSDETKEHALRMEKFAKKLGKRVGVTNSELNKLSLLATLHDIGKTSIPEEILTKPDRLTEQEWQQIKEHPERGYKIGSASEEFAVIAEEVLYHHEKWDGTGYPEGLEGEEIPLLSRIISIVDAYDVMTNGRPYKEPMSKEAALQELQDFAGEQFDPHLVDEFVTMMKTNQ